jgi:hypothetical protein
MGFPATHAFGSEARATLGAISRTNGDGSGLDGFSGLFSEAGFVGHGLASLLLSGSGRIAPDAREQEAQERLRDGPMEGSANAPRERGCAYESRRIIAGVGFERLLVQLDLHDALHVAPSVLFDVADLKGCPELVVARLAQPEEERVFTDDDPGRVRFR